MADENDPRRHTGTFADTINGLRHTRPDMSEAEIDAQGLAAVDDSVYGVGFKRDLKSGAPIPNGVGSPGHETANHFASIKKYEGDESYRRAVAELYKRDPSHAQKLGLPQPRSKT